MATEAETHIEEVKSTNDVKGIEEKDAETIKMEDSEAVKAPATTEAQEVKVDEVKNEEIELVKPTEPLDTEAEETLDNPKAESESTVSEPVVEAHVGVVETQVDEINVVEISKELIQALAEDSVPNIDLQATLEKDNDTAVLEAVGEEAKTAEETSPTEKENVPDPVLIEDTDGEGTTIEESIPNEVDSVPEAKDAVAAAVTESTNIAVPEDVPESAAANPVFLDASDGLLENIMDIPLAPNSIKADEVSGNIEEVYLPETTEEETKVENILEPSVTEKEEESIEIADLSAAIEVPKSLPEISSLETTAKEIQEAVVASEEVEHEVEPVNEISENVIGSKKDEKEEPEAMTGEVKATEEISPVQLSESIPEAVLKEAISEATTDETKTADDSLPKEATENIIESVPDVAVENIEESAVRGTPVQVSDNASVSKTAENEKAVVTESNEEVVPENVPETAGTETPVVAITEEPKAVEKIEEQEKETEVDETVTSEKDTEAVANALEGAEKVEETKEKSLEGLLMQEKAVVAEEPTLAATAETVTDVEKVDDMKETKDGDTALVEKSREVDVDNLVSEKTEKDDEIAKESGEATQAEVQVKSPTHKSGNIFTKMKHSIVKVKKAIIGKSPS